MICKQSRDTRIWKKYTLPTPGAPVLVLVVVVADLQSCTAVVAMLAKLTALALGRSTGSHSLSVFGL